MCCVVHLTYVMVIYIWISNGMVYSEKLHFSRRALLANVHTVEPLVRRFLVQLSAQDCIKHCKARLSCGYINYNLYTHVCYIIQSGNVLPKTASDEAFVYGMKTEFNMDAYTGCNCSLNEACDISTNLPLCQPEDCDLPPPITHAHVTGRLYGIGQNIKYTCDDHFIMHVITTTTATCLPNATWSDVSFMCSDIDECSPNPCYNGNCVDAIGSYSCSCNTGWTGAICDSEINECLPNPCANGDCVDAIGSYSCSCNTGWTGAICDSDIDECSPNPCYNGDCVDAIGSYSCSCNTGWTGAICDSDIDECWPNPCVYGDCVDAIGSYSCSCNTGWTGALCESDIDECSPNPCYNGNCVDAIGSYSCSCNTGWTGAICDSDIDECSPNPCYNGNCVDAIGSYRCSCNTGWTGALCDSDIDDCSPNPCYNGNCVDAIGSDSCTCNTGWTGAICDSDIDECSPNPCYNGNCVDAIGSYSCTCNTGWTGAICDSDIDECSPNPCYNGDCVDAIGSYSCSCNTGWTGAICDSGINECLNSPCVNGNCLDSPGSYSCSCSDGWTGQNCETEICVTGWHFAAGSCYLIVTTHKPYANAVTHCNQLHTGGHLADVTSSGEMDDIKSLYYSLYTVDSCNGLWISTNDIVTENKWLLSTGVKATYTYWAKNQPDATADGDDCCQLWPHDNLRWNDVLCAYGYWFICEYEL